MRFDADSLDRLWVSLYSPPQKQNSLLLSISSFFETAQSWALSRGKHEELVDIIFRPTRDDRYRNVPRYIFDVHLQLWLSFFRPSRPPGELP